MYARTPARTTVSFCVTLHRLGGVEVYPNQNTHLCHACVTHLTGWSRVRLHPGVFSCGSVSKLGAMVKASVLNAWQRHFSLNLRLLDASPASYL